MNVGLQLRQARRLVLLAILPALLVAFASYLYVKREPRTYETSTIVYVQQAQTGTGSDPGATDVLTSQALIPTYSQLIGSPLVAQEVDRTLAAKYPGYRVEDHGLTVGQSGSPATQINTQVMYVTVKDTVPARAAAGADAVATTFIKKITSIQKARFKGGEKAVQQQLNQAQANIQYVSQRISTYKGPASGFNNLKAQLNAYQSIYQTLLTSSQAFVVSRNTAVNGVQIFSHAPVPTSPIAPSPRNTAVLMGFVALLICAGCIFAYDYLDDTPRTPEEVEELVGAPVLGTVQKFDPEQYGTGLITEKHARSPVSESYRSIRTNLHFADVDRPPRSLVVTSAGPTEGKSTTASNLGNVFAQAGNRVVLVDADLRRPSLHRFFALEQGEGLTSMLVGPQQLNGLATQQTEQSNLALIASGPSPPRPADLLGSSRMKEIVAQLREHTDMVLIDSPPLLAVTDAAILSTVTDGVILVVDLAKSKRHDLQRARETIEAVGGRILGVVINRLNKPTSIYYHYYRENYDDLEKYGYKSSRDAGDAKA